MKILLIDFTWCSKSFDFIQSKQRYESAQSENIRAKFDYIFKLKVLEFYFGLRLSIPLSN